MVLLDRQYFIPDDSLPAEVNQDDEVWHLESTGEVFAEYTDYLRQLYLTRSRQWASVYTGVCNLTYDEAVREDERGRVLASKFPPELEEFALGLVHHSVLRLDDLIDYIHEAVKPRAIATQGRDNDLQPEKLKHPAPRPVIRCWLFEVAVHEQVGGCQNFWLAKDEFVDRYGLARTIPQDVQELLAVARARQKPRRGGGAARKRAKLVETASSRAMSEAPSDTNSLDYGMSPGMAGDLSDGDLPSTQGDRSAELPTDGPPPTVEEEEKRYRPGTNKYIAFQVLKEAGPKGLTVPQIMEASRNAGWKEFDETAKRVIQFALASDPGFVRVSKGVYTLRALAPEVARPVLPTKAKGQRTTRPPPPRFDPSAFPEPAAPPAAIEDAYGMDADNIVPVDFLDGSSVLPPLPADADPYQDAAVEEEYLEEEEIEAASSAEHFARKSSAAMDNALARLHKAEEDVAALREAIKAAQAKARNTPKKRKKDAEDLTATPSFEISAEEREYKGDPNDRKGLVKHRQRMKELEEEMESQKQAWLKKQRSARDRSRGVQSKEVQALNKQLQAALQVLDVERYHAAACEEAAMAADRSMHRKGGSRWRGREGDERDMVRMAEREERERRRAEARRYPIDDTELLQELREKAYAEGGEMPAEDVPTAEIEPMDEMTSEALSRTMFVADFATQFAHWLGVRPVGYRELAAAIEAPGTGAIREPLWQLYEGLMRFLLNNTTGRTERRWLNCLGLATWPEVVRRYCLFHPAKFQDAIITDAASMLGERGAEDVPPQLHRELLCHLCNESLDRDPLRALLAARMENAEGVKKEMREAAAGDKGKIKGLVEAEKEQRKKKRAQGKNKSYVEEEDEKPKVEDMEVDFGTTENGDSGFADRRLSRARSGSVVGADESGGDAGEPQWELPEDLQEYRGDPGDRKALLAFRQEQHAARQAMEAERAKWAGEQRKQSKGKGGDKASKAEAERSRAREIAEAEEAVARRQEEFEAELERCAVRRAPLGWDRAHRRYWWGLAGERACIYTEDGAGRIGLMTAPDQLQALMAVLDSRGCREAGLLASCEKAFNAIALGMKRASSASSGRGGMENGDVVAPPRPQALRSSKRDRGQPEHYDPTQNGRQMQLTASQQRPPSLPGVEGLAIATSCEFMMELQRSAIDNDIEPGPSCMGGWKPWLQAVKAAGQGHLPPGTPPGQGDLVTQLREAIKGRLIQMEEALFIASGQRFEPESEAAAEAMFLSGSSGDREGSEERPDEGDAAADENGNVNGDNGAAEAPADTEAADADGPDGPSPAKPQGGGLRMWRAARDRFAWKADVLHAKTSARVAYSAVALTIVSYPLLDKIEAMRLAPPPKPKSGGVTAELEAAAAAGAAAAAAALKAASAKGKKKGEMDDELLDKINTRNRATRR
ncbi:probable Bromodomain adjacent to zinc finger domain protein 1A at N-terminal half [Coccomyxa sp. Obi]|nr:probable Bromodomain adjacent to zinc finger domain protein 1A at N-terminal half [Coccomyxa sp. Obi]